MTEQNDNIYLNVRDINHKLISYCADVSKSIFSENAIYFSNVI